MKKQELSPGVNLYIYDTLPTTMVEARRYADEGALSGTVIVALQQSLGRGRLGRTWVSDPGNLYATFILRPRIQLKEAGKLSLIIGLALKRVLETYIESCRIKLKWPNDVLVEGKKVGGILIEMIPGSEEGTFVLLVGIGVNVMHAPSDVFYPATSLSHEGIHIDPLQLIQSLHDELISLVNKFSEGQYPDWHQDWMDSSFGIEGPVSLFQDSNEPMASGVFAGIDENGSLLIRDEAGSEKAYYVGDVVFGQIPIKARFA